MAQFSFLKLETIKKVEQLVVRVMKELKHHFAGHYYTEVI